MRYPSSPCSPGDKPVVSEVNAVAVVDGATVVMKEPSNPVKVGMQCL